MPNELDGSTLDLARREEEERQREDEEDDDLLERLERRRGGDSSRMRCVSHASPPLPRPMAPSSAPALNTHATPVHPQ